MPQYILMSEYIAMQHSRPLWPRGSLLHGGVEESVTEEVQRPAENHTRIVSCLQTGNQEGVLSNGMRILESKKGTEVSANWFIKRFSLSSSTTFWNIDLCDGTIREIGVRGRGSCQNVQHQRVIWVSHHAEEKR